MELEIFAIGLVLSLAFAGLTGVHAGGIIVPAYMAFYVDQPARLASILVAALVAYGTVVILSRYLLLFGRRQFVVAVLCGAACMMLFSLASPPLIPVTTEFRILGWVIPGLMAHAFRRQGIIMTSSAVVIVTVGTYFAGRLLILFA